jgi:hypothetical protein
VRLSMAPDRHQRGWCSSGWVRRIMAQHQRHGYVTSSTAGTDHSHPWHWYLTAPPGGARPAPVMLVSDDRVAPKNGRPRGRRPTASDGS